MIYAKAAMQLQPRSLRSDQRSSVSYLVLDSDLGRRRNTGSAATPKAGFYTPEKVDPRQVESVNLNLHTRSIFYTTVVCQLEFKGLVFNGEYVFFRRSNKTIQRQSAATSNLLTLLSFFMLKPGDVFLYEPVMKVSNST